MSLSIVNVTPNIQNIIIDQLDDQYKFTTTVNFLARNMSKVKKDYFVLYCMDASLFAELIGTPGTISSYISKAKSDKNLVISQNQFQYEKGFASTYTPEYQQANVIDEIHINREKIDYLSVITVTAKPITLRKVVNYSVTNKDILKVLEGGIPPRNNIVLYENEAQSNIWLGPFYVDNMGEYRKTNNTLLYSKQVPNAKVVYRSLLGKNLFKTVENNFDSLFDFNKGINTRDSIYNKLSTESTNYFSDLYFAKTKNLNLPLSFSFNKLAYSKNNTLFGRLIKNNLDLLNSLEVKDVKFLRKRLSSFIPSNRLTAAGPSLDFDKLEEPVGGDTNYVNLLNIDTILTAQTTDTEIKNKTFGLYQYGVEISLIDKTAQTITDLIGNESNGLSVNSARLKDIYSEASLSSNYDVYSKQLTESYKLRYKQEREIVVLDAIKGYVGALSVFYENFSLSLQESPNSLALKIYDSSNPLRIGPEGIKDLIEVVDGLISEIQIFIKRGNINPGAAQNIDTKVSRLGNGSRIIKIKHFFDQVVDAEDLINNGYDYLSVEEGEANQPSYSNFRILSFDQFNQVKTVETTKYDNLVFNDKDDVSLTPNYFSLYGNQNKVNLPDPISDTNDSVIATKILVSKAYRNSPIDLASGEISNNNTDTPDQVLQVIKNSLLLMDRNNCNIEIQVGQESSGLFGEVQDLQDADNYIDAAEKMSEHSPFVINKAGSVSLNNFIFSTANNNTEAAYLNQIEKLDTEMLMYLTQTDYFTLDKNKKNKKVKNLTDKKVFGAKNNTFDTFNQQVVDQEAAKSTRSTNLPTLFSPTSEQEFYPPQELVYSNMTNSTVSASQVPDIALKFGNVRKIEYLAGFKQTSNSLFMKDPVWVSLTQGLLTNILNSSTTLLCRFVEYASQFSKYEGISYPIYDEIFLIGNDLPVTNTDSNVSAGISLAGIGIPTNESNDEVEFSFADVQQVPFTQALNTSIPQQMQEENNPNENLYTNGNDFLLPNGDKYVGAYHIRYSQQQRKNIVMVGPVHTSNPHEILAPISNKARRILKDVRGEQ